MYRIKLVVKKMLKTETRNQEFEHPTTREIVFKKQLNSQVKLVEIYAPDIAEKAKPGQFVILKTHANSERIPLTLATWEKATGTITLIFQEVGFSTFELGRLETGDVVQHIAGPLGTPSEIRKYGKVAVVCGGVGTAAAYPIAKALKEAGNSVTTIIGARNKDLFILESEMRAVSDEFHISTDDGSKGQKGFVSDILKKILSTRMSYGALSLRRNSGLNIVYAIGPPLMMNAISEVTRPYGVKTVVSLNPIMVDGMGMCGACRVSVGDKTRFACVDGPEFDAHQVNFRELIQRLKSYSTEEKSCSQSNENLGGVCTCHKH
jgi:ferredoxin--NADP+ reductase